MSASFTITTFSDVLASTKHEQSGVNLRTLCEGIGGKTGARKEELPLIKLATFGDKRTLRGSLRWDGNVQLVYGVEGDYDGEVMSFDDAVAAARTAGVAAVLYTTPSHSPEKPRWRVLCPFSGEVPPAGRSPMADRLNAIFGGVLAGETKTLSQAFYYGRVEGREFRRELVEGESIDRLHIAGGAIPARAPTVPGKTRSERALSRARTLKLAGRIKSYEEMREALLNDPTDITEWVSEKGIDRGEHELRNIWDLVVTEGVVLDDFYAHMPTHSYIFTPTRAMWPAASVNARIPPIPLLDAQGQPLLDDKCKPMKVPAATWLDRHRPVEQMTWAPGKPMTIPDKLVLLEGGWIDRPGVTCFNLYHPPVIEPGNAMLATRWEDHVRRVYPTDADHIIDWLAHRAQRPEEKINHALVLGGEQGIGKDTLIEPARYAVGPWNCQEASPGQILGRFNGFLKSVILRISEARDLGEFDRFQFYDHMKTYTAAPPDVLRVDEKNLREHPVVNCCGVIITTNHKTDGIFLLADDRRHYVAWSDLTKEEFEDGYWKQLWNWYSEGGIGHVTAFLRERDISGFDAKAPPAKTEAFWAIVNANRPAEESEMADVLDLLGNPNAITLDRLRAKATEISGSFYEWLCERRNRKAIPHRLERCGYVAVRKADARDGLWKIGDVRVVVYAKKTLSLREQNQAAGELTNGGCPQSDGNTPF